MKFNSFLGFYFSSQRSSPFSFLMRSYKRTDEMINNRPVFKNKVSTAKLFLHQSGFWVVEYISPVKSWLQVVTNSAKNYRENHTSTQKSKFELELEKILGSDNMVFIRNVTDIDTSKHGWLLKLLDKEKVNKFLNRGRIMLWAAVMRFKNLRLK